MTKMRALLAAAPLARAADVYAPQLKFKAVDGTDEAVKREKDLIWSSDAADLEVDAGVAAVKDKKIPFVKCVAEGKKVHDTEVVAAAGGDPAVKVLLGTGDAKKKKVNDSTDHKVFLSDANTWKTILEKNDCVCENSRPEIQGLSMSVDKAKLTGEEWSPCIKPKAKADVSTACDQLAKGPHLTATGGLYQAFGSRFKMWDYTTDKCYSCTKKDKAYITPSCPGHLPVCRDFAGEGVCGDAGLLIPYVGNNLFHSGIDDEGNLGPCQKEWGVRSFQGCVELTEKPVSCRCSCLPGFMWVSGADTDIKNTCLPDSRTTYVEGTVTLSSAKSRAVVGNDMALLLHREFASTDREFESWAASYGQEALKDLKKQLKGLVGSKILVGSPTISNPDQSAIAKGEDVESQKEWNYQFSIKIGYQSTKSSVEGNKSFPEGLDTAAAMNTMAKTLEDGSALKGAKFAKVKVATSSASSLAAASAIVALLVVTVF